MSRSLPDPSSVLAPHILAFVDHKRALNRKYDVEDKALRLFDRHLTKVGVNSLAEITPVVLDIPGSRHNPKILRVYDSEVVSH